MNVSNNLLQKPKQLENQSLKEIWRAHIKKPEHLAVFKGMLRGALDSLKALRYTDFDAHTTSNCCHGLAFHAQSIILQVLEAPLCMHKIIEEALAAKELCLEELPELIYKLTSLYFLRLCSEFDPEKGRKTVYDSANIGYGVSTTFVKKLVKRLQKNLSNYVTKSYQRMDVEDVSTCGIPGKMWQKYVSKKFLKKDKLDILYAPCLYSMQTLLSHLVKLQAIICIVVVFEREDRTYRSFFFKGDGKSAFNPVLNKAEIDEKYPIMVFSGCSTTELDLESFEEQFYMSWRGHVSELILACDVFYPQFPKVSNDPSFDSSKIDPKEDQIAQTIDLYSKIKGVTWNNAKLFCLSHIFVSNTYQIKIKKNDLFKSVSIVSQ